MIVTRNEITSKRYLTWILSTPISSSYSTTAPKKVKKAKKARKGHDYSIEEPQVLDPSKFEVKSETVKSTSRFCAPEPRWVEYKSYNLISMRPIYYFDSHIWPELFRVTNIRSGNNLEGMTKFGRNDINLEGVTIIWKEWQKLTDTHRPL